MTHSELDDLFRANSDRGEFSPQPGEWEEMTALLDADERRERYKKIVSVAWMFLFVVLIVWGVFGAYYFSKDQNQQQAVLESFVDTNGEESSAEIAQELVPNGQVSTGSTDHYTDNQLDGDARGDLSAQEAEKGSLRAVEEGNANGFATSAFAKTGSRAYLPDSDSSIDVVSVVKDDSVNTAQTPFTGGLLKDAQVSSLSSGNPASSLDQRGASKLEPDSRVDKDNQEQAFLAGLKVENDRIEEGNSSDYEIGKNVLRSAISTEIDEPSATILSTLEISGIRKVRSEEYALTIPSIQEINIFTPKVVVKKRSVPTYYRLGVIGAGEVTSVGMESALRWGIHGGFNVHVMPAEHWGFQAGLLYGRKLYHAREGAYHMKPGFWTGDVAATDTESKSNFFEIPMMATYFLRGRSERSMLLTAGISSYIFQREEFSYEYPMELPGQIHNHSMKFKNSSLFGIANIQIGYRIPTDQRLAYRISSYAQVPLSGVGYGSVALYSGGVSFEVEF